MTRTTLSAQVSRPSEPARDSPTPVVDEYSAIRCPVLRAAARRVCDTFRNDHGDAIDRTELVDVTVALASRIADLAGTRPLSEPIDKSMRTPLAQHLLDLVRTDAVRRWSEGEGGGDVDVPALLSYLRAFEVVRCEIDPAWSEHFASHLSGPGALDLVVEVAHDLRSPLTSILFLAETLQRGQSGPVNEVQHRQLGLIYGAALALSGATSDVIELARGGDRLVEEDLAPFSVTEILESVRDIVRPIAEEKGLEVRIRPPETDHRRGHPLALSRVLLNLTTNALKFTDSGWVEVKVVSKARHRMEFSVRDTGRGISPEALESLYQPFRRTAARRGYCFSGTGLGLAICRKLVEAMGSQLDVETRPDWGTRFHFSLDLPRAASL
ncbi:MAG: HAMP domain-containing histidine kinase [Gemmatimonadetes bacterium]|nr:HAMP domain-containing histidine kinase [Gemmatimonadota bacterium]